MPVTCTWKTAIITKVARSQGCTYFPKTSITFPIGGEWLWGLCLAILGNILPKQVKDRRDIRPIFIIRIQTFIRTSISHSCKQYVRLHRAHSHLLCHRKAEHRKPLMHIRDQQSKVFLRVIHRGYKCLQMLRHWRVKGMWGGTGLRSKVPHTPRPGPLSPTSFRGSVAGAQAHGGWTLHIHYPHSDSKWSKKFHGSTAITTY